MYIPLGLLRRHVRESNRIEYIRQRSGVALVRSHLNAAVQVAREASQGRLIDPRWLHFTLSRGTRMEGFGGELRRCSIYVDEYAMPRWEELPRLYEEWCGLVLDCEKYKDASTKERARIARWLHDFFLCIHPFEDGNGRTARLVLNMLRLRYGLPWLIIEHKDRLVYYREIKQLQESVFKAHYPDVYPADGLGELTEA